MRLGKNIGSHGKEKGVHAHRTAAILDVLRVAGPPKTTSCFHSCCWWLCSGRRHDGVHRESCRLPRGDQGRLAGTAKWLLVHGVCPSLTSCPGRERIAHPRVPRPHCSLTEWHPHLQVQQLLFIIHRKL